MSSPLWECFIPVHFIWNKNYGKVEVVLFPKMRYAWELIFLTLYQTQNFIFVTFTFLAITFTTMKQTLVPIRSPMICQRLRPFWSIMKLINLWIGKWTSLFIFLYGFELFVKRWLKITILVFGMVAKVIFSSIIF